MAVKIVADLHGAHEALRQQVRADDTLLLLGDLVNIIDYRDRQGILIDLFGSDAVASITELRAQGRFDEARRLIAQRREGREEDIAARWRSMLQTAYREVFAALPHRTLLILGNADTPAIAEEVASQHADMAVEWVDGKVVELEGTSAGFVGGGLPTPMGIAGEITEEEFNAKLDAIAGVDVVCTHMPPNLPELTYDTVSMRHMDGSQYLVDHIKRHKPRRVYFGHVHQPLISSTHVGKTHLVNAGYFRHTHRALDL